MNCNGSTIVEIPSQIYNTPACPCHFFMLSAEVSSSFFLSANPDVVAGHVIHQMFNGSLIFSRNRNEAVYLARETPQHDVLWKVADTTAVCHRRVQITNGHLIAHPRETPSLLMPGKNNLEDFRTHNYVGGTTIGMTVVESGKPLPGYMRVERGRDQSSYYTEPQRLYFAEGKNFTPIGPFKGYKDAFLFRPEGDINNHVLQIWGLDSEGKPHFIQDLSFEQGNGIPPWGAYRMGTTGGDQFFQSKNKMVMLIHGMTKEIRGGQNPYDFYRYSIGAAEFEMTAKGWLKVRSVSPSPLITPEHTKQYGKERSEQREVVYACGLVPVDSGIWVLVNKGDKLTVPIFLSHEQIKDSFSDEPRFRSTILSKRRAA